MKSVLQAGWLLTVAFGNVIVLIVAEGAGLEQVRSGSGGMALDKLALKIFVNKTQCTANVIELKDLYLCGSLGKHVG